MHPFQQQALEANSPPSSGDRRNNFQRRRPGLSIPVPPRDPTTAIPVPLPLPPRRTEAAPLPPINISDVQQMEYLGSGRGGVVFRAVHPPTNKNFALKIITGEHEPGERKHIEREVKILRSVDHPNVVKCHDMCENNNKIHVLLEFMDVGSLNGARIMSETTLANVTKQILSGMVYLHSMKIVHRDLKPSNLLINSRNEVKIADFGVSRILSRTMDPCNSSVGTIIYMSPERINIESNDGKYDGYAGDVWSLGICVLEFYLGRLPFNGVTKETADWATLVCAICMSTPPAAPPNTSREFQDFINCCLRRDPTERWTAPMLLQHPFILMYGGATSASGGGSGGGGQGRQSSVYQQNAPSSSSYY